MSEFPASVVEAVKESNVSQSCSLVTRGFTGPSGGGLLGEDDCQEDEGDDEEQKVPEEVRRVLQEPVLLRRAECNASLSSLSSLPSLSSLSSLSQDMMAKMMEMKAGLKCWNMAFTKSCSNHIG